MNAILKRTEPTFEKTKHGPMRQHEQGFSECTFGKTPNRIRAATGMLAQQKLLSTRARCHWGISVATRSGKLADYALPRKWIDGFQQNRTAGNETASVRARHRSR
jgi:hypothetical protein